MTAGRLPIRHDHPAPRSSGVTRSLGWTSVAALLLLAAAIPAEAQRPGIGGRRWRSPPPAPRGESPPRAPRPSAPAGTTATGKTPIGAQQPGAGKTGARGAALDPSKESKPDGKKGGSPPPPGKKQGDDRPQTTGTSAPENQQNLEAAKTSAEVPSGPGWDGPAPFSDAWRADHPGAWRPDDGAGDIVLAGGSRLPTWVEPGAVELARWTASDPASDPAAGNAAAQSVLQASAELPSPDEAVAASDLVVFPGADGTLPAAVVPRDDSPQPESTEKVALDGTVSVLVRDPEPPVTNASGVGTRATASVFQEERASPWLPLGAFAAMPIGGREDGTPHVFLELSLHRDGTVRGNYFDAVSDAVHPVAGRFDRETGSLRWRIGGAGAEFETMVDGLARGRVEATVRRGTTERSWQLIALP